jgi:hypothetical protein
VPFFGSFEVKLILRTRSRLKASTRVSVLWRN